MNLYGIILGLATFLLIGLFHPLVIKSEYHFGVGCWPVFLVAGIAACLGSLFVGSIYASVLLGVTGFSCFWSIKELFEQRERVRKGWFPKKEAPTPDIVFDLGGVLLDLDMQGVAAACRRLGIDPELFFVKSGGGGSATVCQGISAGEAVTAYQVGEITTEQFLSLVQREARTDVTREELVEAWNSCLGTIPRHRLDMLLELRRQGYHTHLLSNTNDLHWQEVVRLYFSSEGYTTADLFDRVFLSQELHLAKPDPEIYRHVLRTIGRQAGLCVFIDDARENVEAARQEGMQGIWLDVGKENALAEILGRFLHG